MRIFKLPRFVLNQIELHDSEYWLKCCEKELKEAYDTYLEALQRYKKIRKKENPTSK